MSKQPEAAKLTALRARTDRQLIALINNQLDRVLRSDFDAEDTERIYREVSQLLPVLHGAVPAERRRVEAKLARLADSVRPRVFVA